MKKEPVIVLAEDDDGHVGLVIYNLKEAGITNEILHLKDGEETLNFFFKRGDGPRMKEGGSYVLLLDIRLPGIDGIEVLRRIKEDKWVNHIPVIMISTMEAPEDIEKCKELGCHNYVVKPASYENFSKTIEELGQYIQTEILPHMGNN